MGQAFAQSRGDVTVWIALPGNQPTLEHLGLPLQKAGIQPLWLRVENRSKQPYWLLPAYTDPAYYSSAEVARNFRGAFSSEQERRRQWIRVEEVGFDHYIPPNSDQNGFLYTAPVEGSRLFSVALLSTGSLQRFDFFVPTERLQADYRRQAAAWWQEATNTAQDGEASIQDLDRLRHTLKALPSHTRNAASTSAGDPLNFFVVAPWDILFPALISSGWDETEGLNLQTAFRTTQAFLLQSSYRHSPVSPLYVLNRRQDAAFQKIRSTINARNHLRLWRLPVSYRGQPVWAGQISRDIGVRTTTRTPWLTTHEIDPDVDGARWALAQDLIKAQAVSQIGFVEGGTLATPLAPLRNLTGDPYFTDGLRAVFILSKEPLGADEIEFLPWACPPRGGLSQPGDHLKPLDAQDRTGTEP